MILQVIFFLVGLAPLAVALAPKSISAIYLLMGSLTFLDRARKKQSLLPIPVNRSFAYVLIIGMIYLACSLIWSPSFEEGLPRLLRLIMEIYFAILMSKSFSVLFKENINKLKKSLFWGLTIASSYLLIEFITNAFIGELLNLNGMRGHDDLSEYNRATTYLLIISIAYFFMIAKDKLKIKDFLLLISLPIVAFLSDSASAKIGIVAAIVCYSFPYFIPISILKRLLQIGFVAVLVIFPILMKDATHSQFLNQFIDPMDGAQKHRFIIWEFASQKGFEKPITGWGFDSAYSVPGAKDVVPITIVDREAIREVKIQHIPSHTHNFIMQIWLELGGIGIALSCILFVIFIDKKIQNLSQTQSAVFISLIAMLATVGGLAYGLWQSQWISTILLGFILSQSIGRPDNMYSQRHQD